jgi:DNA-binding transcriptional MerR regulator
MTGLNESILNDSLFLAQQQLQDFAQSKNFWMVLDSVFGTEYDRAQATAIQQAWQANDFSLLPEIQVLDNTSMSEIQGGFSAQTGKIYINADFLANATADQIAAVLIEEIGHLLDSQLNVNDTLGDEGEVFAAALLGQLVSPSALTEDDSGVLQGDDQKITVEKSTDSTAPLIQSLSLSSNSVDASSGEGRIGLSLQVSDNSSGFYYGGVVLRSPNGQQYFSIGLSDPSNLVNGTELSGTYAGTSQLPQGAQAGTWTFDYLYLVDDTGNYRYYYSNDLQSLGINPSSLNFTVSNSNSDTTAPVLQSLSLSSNSVDASSGEGRIGLSLQVSDNSSGFYYGSVVLRSPNGQQYFSIGLSDPSNLVNGTELSGTYAGTSQLPQGAQAGTWTFSNLYLYDDAGNYRYYYSNDLQSLGINPSSLDVDVTNDSAVPSPVSDTTAPALQSLSLSSNSVDASSGEGRIGLSLQVSDNSSGFYYGGVVLRSPNGQQYFSIGLSDPSNLVNGTELSGTYAGTSQLPQGAQAGTWTFDYLYLVDDTGNYRYYYSNDLQSLGINPSSLNFTVSNSNSDTTAPVLQSLSLSSNSVDASSGEGRIGLSLQVSDNSSGFYYGSVVLRSPNGQQYFSIGLSDPSNLVNGTELSGTYAGTSQLPQGAQAGTWTFDYLYLVDDTGNYRYYYSNDLQSLGINPSSLDVDVTQGLNRSPILDINQSPALAAISEDTTNLPGNTVAEIVANGSITDPDITTGVAPEAIAISSVDNARGTWQYKLSSTTTWTAFNFSGSNAGKVLLLDSNASIRFVPNANYNGTATFTFKAWDKSAGVEGTYTYFSATSPALSVASDTASITITPVNDAPIVSKAIANQNATEDLAFSFTISDGTFADVEGDNLTFTASLENGDALPSWLTFNATTKTFSGTPANQDVGAISVRITASDGQASISDVFELAIANTNDAPTLTGASATLIKGTEDTAYTISPTNLLQGFSDVDGDTLSVANLTATNGTLINNKDGTWNFSPAANFNGTVDLTYNVVDGNGGSIAATQSFTVDAVNDVPTGSASASLSGGTEDTAYTISATNLLQGFSDVDEDTLSVADLDATHGTLVKNSDGTWSFTSDGNFNGVVDLTYNVVDGKGGSIAANQSFTIAPVNDAPIVKQAIAAQNTLEDSPFTFTIPTDTFSDVDGDALTYTATLEDGKALPTWLTFNGTTFSGTPTNDNVGSLSLKVTASDGKLSVSNLFNLSIANTNDAPTATNDNLATNEDVPLTINAATLLGNDVDVDLGDSLSITAVTQPGQGQLIANGDGTYSYTPNANYNGTDSFTYTIRDREGATSTASVNLTVNAVNDNPDAINDIVTARQGTTKTFLAADLLANDSDIEGNTLTLTQVSNAQNGTAALDSNGNVIFTANANVTTASFEYTLSDGNGGTDTAVVSVLVGMTNDGGNGPDTLNGTAGDDVLNGGNGDDVLLAMQGTISCWAAMGWITCKEVRVMTGCMVAVAMTC